MGNTFRQIFNAGHASATAGAAGDAVVQPRVPSIEITKIVGDGVYDAAEMTLSDPIDTAPTTIRFTFPEAPTAAVTVTVSLDTHQLQQISPVQGDPSNSINFQLTAENYDNGFTFGIFAQDTTTQTLTISFASDDDEEYNELADVTIAVTGTQVTQAAKNLTLRANPNIVNIDDAPGPADTFDITIQLSDTTTGELRLQARAQRSASDNRPATTFNFVPDTQNALIDEIMTLVIPAGQNSVTFTITELNVVELSGSGLTITSLIGITKLSGRDNITTNLPYWIAVQTTDTNS